MASLANQTISSTYDGLIKTSSDNAVPVSGVQALEDGSGNALALSVGRSGQGVTVTGSLNTTLVTMGQNLIDGSSDNLKISADSGNVSGSSTIEFLVDGSERMRIDSSGRVGIGTSSPESTLHVSTNSSVNQFILERTGTSTGKFKFLTLNNTLVIRNEALATDNLIIDSSGNVGIGTSSPVSIGGYSGILNLYGSNATAIVLENSTSAARIAKLGGDLAFFTSTEGERMRIDSSGNVGIGTSSPSSRGLQINKASADSGLVITRTGTGAAEFQQFIDSSGNIRFNNTSSTASIFYTANTERMRIDSSGNVLVGKTSAAISSDGVENRNDGLFVATRTSGTVAIFNRRTTDGDLIEFRKDSGSVGKISVSASGASIYLGGTAAANALDDYEEGDFVPEVADAETGGNVAASGSYNAHYTKIGRQVTVVMQNSNIDTTGMTSGNDLWIRNLPFQSGGLSGSPLWIGATRVSAITASANSLGFQTVMAENASAVRIFEMIDSANSQAILVSTINSGASDIWITLTYFV